jgi:ATP-dependent RNA helicase DeaD
VATALASMLRATLPVPEELTLNAPPRPARAARPDGNGVWFRISLGRRDNADPRWLLPLLCRRGDLTRHEIGRIQILDRETRVEIAAEAAPRMAAALANDESDPRITPETNVRPRLGASPSRKRERRGEGSSRKRRG